MTRRDRGATPRERGFTLLELLVVVALVALVMNVVAVNAGAFLPKTVLESETRRFVSSLDFVRSEARIRGKPYRVDLDLSRHRWRVVLPPQDQVDPNLPADVKPEEMPLQWTPIDDRLEFTGFGRPRGDVLERDVVSITFDDHGFTADFALFYRLKSDHDFVATVRLRGLMGTAEILVTVDGKYHPFPKVEEASF
jgi:type II secretion system protein H